MHTELADARCTAEYMLSSGAEEGLRAPSEGLVLDAQSSQIQHAQPKACSRQEPKKKVFELKPKACYGMHTELADARCTAEYMLSSGAEEEGLRARSEGLVWDARRACRYKMLSRKHALVRSRSRRRRSSSSKRRPGMGCTQSSQIQDAQPKTCPVEEKVFEIQGAKAMGARRYKTHIRKHDPVRIFPPRLWLGASPWFGVSPFDRRKPNIGRLQSTFQVHVQQNRLGQDPRSR